MTVKGGAVVKKKLVVGIGVALVLGINVALILRGRTRMAPPFPAQTSPSFSYPVYESAHGKRLLKEIDRVSKLSHEELEAKLDDDRARFYSGAVDGGSLMPQMDFPVLLACRLRRRFIREVDPLPAVERREIARRIYDKWFAEQRILYDEVLEWFRDQTKPRPTPRGGQLRLAVATGLFCCARWSSAADVIQRIESTFAFSDELRTRLAEIPDVPEASRRIMPTTCVPDNDCLINVLIYAGRRDQTLSQATRDALEQRIVKFRTAGLVAVPVQWNAWDAKIDWFDIGPLKLGENDIDRRPTDESIIWFRFLGDKMTNQQRQILDDLMQLLSEKPPAG